jgi:Uma2 family endonuclease
MQLLNLNNPSQDSEQRIVLAGVTWQQYDTLVSLFINQFPALRMTYLEGTLELMTTSPEHERFKTIIGRLLEAYAEERDLDLNGYGSTTFRREAAARGLEPDECYCLGELQEVPDLAIEVALTSGGIDKLSVYQGLGVKEVWFWQNQGFSVYVLGQTGYVDCDRSQLLPGLDLQLLSSFIDTAHQTPSVKAYRQALRTQAQ